MFVQNSNESRQFFVAVRKKMLGKQILQPLEALIADILHHHPEYDELLDDPKKALSDQYISENFEINPFLHLGLHVALQEQLDANRPAGIKSLYQNMRMKLNIDDHDIRHLMMQCLAESLHKAQATNAAPSDNDYLDCLRQI